MRILFGVLFLMPMVFLLGFAAMIDPVAMAKAIAVVACTIVGLSLLIMP